VPVPDYTALLGNSIKGLKLGRVIEYCDSGTNDKDIQGSLNRAIRTLQELGAHIQDVSIPLLSLAAPIFVSTADVDFAHAWEEILRTRAMDLDSHTRTRCFSALLTPPNLYHKGQRARRLLREKVIEALQSVDALISPTGPKPSQKIASLAQPFRTKEDVRRVMFESRSYMSAYSLSGLPAITIPCGFTESNLPIGLQIAGRPFTEDVLFQIAHAFESATEYHLRRPPLD
jgi:Asp-tRNA(Asn)/Glu-tRNA(Gln) amidotransferase A subunit family amidase